MPLPPFVTVMVRVITVPRSAVANWLVMVDILTEGCRMVSGDDVCFVDPPEYVTSVCTWGNPPPDRKEIMEHVALILIRKLDDLANPMDGSENTGLLRLLTDDSVTPVPSTVPCSYTMPVGSCTAAVNPDKVEVVMFRTSITNHSASAHK